MATHAGLTHVCEDRQTMALGCTFQWDKHSTLIMAQCDLGTKVLLSLICYSLAPLRAPYSD